MKTLKNAFLLAAATVTLFAQNGAQVQTKNNMSMYYWIYPVTAANISLPGQVPASTVQSGVAVAVQSSDPTVTGFVVTLTYLDSGNGTQTAIHKFKAVAADYATEMFPVGAITSVTSIGVIPTVAQQEVVFSTTPPTNPSATEANFVPVKKRPSPAARQNN